MDPELGVDNEDTEIATSNSDSPREEPLFHTDQSSNTMSDTTPMETEPIDTKTNQDTTTNQETKTTTTTKRKRASADPNAAPKKRIKKTPPVASPTPQSALPSAPFPAGAGFVVYDTNKNPLYHVVPMMFTGFSTMVPFPTAAPVSADTKMDIDAEEVGDEQEAEPEPKTKKIKKTKPRKPHGPFDSVKYMNRIRGLLAKPGEREARRGSIITEKNMSKRLTKLTEDELKFVHENKDKEAKSMSGADLKKFKALAEKAERYKDVTEDDLKFVQKEQMSGAELERLKSIADKTQYHGFFLKYVFGKEGAFLGRFVNESTRALEEGEEAPKDGRPVYADNTADDLKKRAQKTGRVIMQKTDEVVRECPETKVIYIGEVSGPGLHRPLMTEYRIMNADYGGVSTSDSAVSSASTTLVVSPKRSPGRPKGSKNTPEPKPRASVPPPQSITKAPAPAPPPVKTGPGHRTVSTSLKTQVVHEASKMNGFHPPGDE